MNFDSFIGIDWSGDKSKLQKGISVAKCKSGTNPPDIIKPKDKYWSRTALVEWLTKEIKNKKTLIGFDFSFSYPFYDFFSYFPGIKDSPTSPYRLWERIDCLNNNIPNYYGGEIWNNKPYCDFYNAPNLKGKFYKSRRRQTELYAKNKIHSPSPTFNCVGPGAVGTGSLSGMRVLNKLKTIINIWPFNFNITKKESIAIEIFPTYYFRYAGVKSEKKIGYTLNRINEALHFYNCNSLPKNIIIGGPDQDDADAIVSAAAMRFFCKNSLVWNVPNVSKKEGWIFGV
jgi:hypothetical protein